MIYQPNNTFYYSSISTDGTNGILQEQPVLQVPVNTESERGLLGIATSNDSGGSPSATNVYLYYTEGDPSRDRVYKYQWNGETLINPQLILDLPAEPSPNHDGDKIAVRMVV